MRQKSREYIRISKTKRYPGNLEVFVEGRNGKNIGWINLKTGGDYLDCFDDKEEVLTEYLRQIIEGFGTSRIAGLEDFYQTANIAIDGHEFNLECS